MRISDWSSDVCSSDLVVARKVAVGHARGERGHDDRCDRRRRHSCRRLSHHAAQLERGKKTCKPCCLIESVHPRSCHSRSEEHTSELQSLMRISYAVFCLKKKKKNSTLIYTMYKDKRILTKSTTKHD